MEIQVKVKMTANSCSSDLIKRGRRLMMLLAEASRKSRR
jgi:hypothetical protein